MTMAHFFLICSSMLVITIVDSVSFLVNMRSKVVCREEVAINGDDLDVPAVLAGGDG
jgi:hypothetical protein